MQIAFMGSRIIGPAAAGAIVAAFTPRVCYILDVASFLVSASLIGSVVIRRPAPGLCSRLGVTVSKRVGNAVVRSRVKRLLREVFRARRGDIKPPSDVLVIAKPGADTLTYAQAATEFVRTLELSAGG